GLAAGDLAFLPDPVSGRRRRNQPVGAFLRRSGRSGGFAFDRAMQQGVGQRMGFVDEDFLLRLARVKQRKGEAGAGAVEQDGIGHGWLVQSMMVQASESRNSGSDKA